MADEDKKEAAEKPKKKMNVTSSLTIERMFVDLTYSVNASTITVRHGVYTLSENGLSSNFIFSVKQYCSSLIRSRPSNDFESEFNTILYLNTKKKIQDHHLLNKNEIYLPH